MTLTDISKLTPDELNRIVAEWDGLCTHPKEFRTSETVEDGNDSDTTYWCTKCNKDYIYNPGPKYHEDANAVARARRRLDDEQQIYFLEHLRPQLGDNFTRYGILDSTPHQQTIALVAVIKGVRV